MDKETKCANYNNCKNEKEWDKDIFFHADDIEKIRIFLCDDCYKSSPLPYHQWSSLKNGVMNKLKK